jgi:hypothetical protein
MSAWKLFLDDERDPVGTGWTVCRSVAEVVAVVRIFGLPGYVSFDHDLGPGPAPVGYENSGMGLARWITDQIMDGAQLLPAGFGYYVHSQNLVGAANITGLLDKFLENTG